MAMTPPNVGIPRRDSPRDRIGSMVVSFVFHALLIGFFLWQSHLVESLLLEGDLEGGGGGGSGGDEPTLISLEGPPEPPPVEVFTPPVPPTPEELVIPDPEVLPTPVKPPRDTVEAAPPTPTPAPPAPVVTAGGDGAAGAGSSGSGGGAGGGTGGGTGVGTGAGSGSGSGGGGGGGTSSDGIIPPSPSALQLPPTAPKSLKGKVVVVIFSVDETGRVLDAQLKQSSGNSKYDATLRKTAMSWRFRPARNRLGQAVRATTTATYTL